MAMPHYSAIRFPTTLFGNLTDIQIFLTSHISGQCSVLFQTECFTPIFDHLICLILPEICLTLIQVLCCCPTQELTKKVYFTYQSRECYLLFIGIVSPLFSLSQCYAFFNQGSGDSLALLVEFCYSFYSACQLRSLFTFCSRKILLRYLCLFIFWYVSFFSFCHLFFSFFYNVTYLSFLILQLQQ